jgi:hypothetical protein
MSTIGTVLQFAVATGGDGQNQQKGCSRRKPPT